MDDLRRHAAAVVHAVKLVGTAVAQGRGCLFDALELGVDLGNLVIAQGDAVFLRIVEKGLDLLNIGLGGVTEVVPPGPAVGHGALLILQAGQAEAGVNAQHGRVIAVGVDQVHIVPAVIVIDLRRRVLGGVCRQRRGHGIHETGVEQQDGGDQNDHADHAPGPSAS